MQGEQEPFQKMLSYCNKSRLRFEPCHIFFTRRFLRMLVLHRHCDGMRMNFRSGARSESIWKSLPFLNGCRTTQKWLSFESYKNVLPTFIVIRVARVRRYA